MNKIYTAGIAALFAAVAIAATTVPASAHMHHHHGHGGWGWGGGIVLDFGGPSYVYDNPDPIYCVGRHGHLYVCGYN
jgi:hypothetical protein